MSQGSAAAAKVSNTASVKVVVNVDSQWKDIGTQVRATLFTSLVSEGLFGRVVGPTETSDYVLEVQVTDVKKVSGGTRFMVGALAGRNHVNATVRLMKRGSAETVMSFNAKGESSSMPLAAEGEMADAVRELDKQIRTGLKK